MKLYEFITHAKDYIYFAMEKDPFDALLHSEKKEHYMIVPNSISIHRQAFVELFKRYNLAEMYELSNCFLGAHCEPYMLFHLVATPVDYIKVSVYDKPAHLYRDDIYDPQSGILRISDKYTDDFLHYLQKLDAWRATGKQPEDIKLEEQFRSVPFSEFNNEIVYTRFYMDYHEETRRVLRDEQIVDLSEIAEVFQSHWLMEGGHDKVRVLDGNKQLKYPFIPDLDTVESFETSVKLKIGDIVESRGRYLLVDKSADYDMYAPAGTQVIRTKGSIIPEYLYLYLTSRIATRIYRVLNIPAGTNSSAVSRGLKDFPIVMPKDSPEHYIELFKKISSPDERIYQRLKSPASSSSVSDILTAEFIETIQLNNDTLLHTQIEKDIAELNRCYEVKAYKSTLMLAGSILEAFLIDWISEIEGRNYFTEDLLIERNGEEQKADLDGYIHYLFKYFYPRWNRYSYKSHDIRKMRNLVHVKLCLTRTEEITADVCIKMIDNLKEVIESREKFSTL